MDRLEDHSERGHALYAPSSMHRIMNCHGSLAASEGLEDKSSIYAEEGTECHEAAAAILKGGDWNKAVANLTEEQEWMVEEYTEYCFGLIDKLIDKFGKENVKIWVETRVRSPLDKRLKNNHGTADLRILAGRTLAVIDLKCGFIDVDIGTAEDPNEQLANYGFLSLDHEDLWDEVDKVRLTIFQPRISAKPKILMMTPGDLRRFSARVLATIEAIEGGDTTRVAGNWCKYCPARGRCPALREKAVQKAKVVFDNPTHARNYAPEELTAILDEAEMIQTHIDGVRMHVMNELLKGRLKGQGWKLVPKRAMSKWLEGQFDVMLNQLHYAGGHSDLAFKPKALTPLQLQTALKKAKIDFDISGYFEKKSSGPTLARADDPREEYVPDIFGKEDDNE